MKSACLTTFLATLFLSFVTLLNTLPASAQTPSWEETLKEARGQTVDWYMWGGSPAVNTYVNKYLVQELKTRYDITLRQVPVKDIAEVVGKLLVEKQAGKLQNGSVDLMWINGENFRTCKQEQLLYGPFTSTLPNLKYVDSDKATVQTDFGTLVEGMESPWGSAQFVMIYDSARTPNPPKSMAGLIEWIKANPGRFTYPAPPDFTGSVFVRHFFYHLSGSADKWQTLFEPAAFDQVANATYGLLKSIKSSLWRQGSTYPDSPVRMNTLFADQEIDFSFSYSQGEASLNIAKGLFPETVRTFVFNEGTIANTHFVAIPFNAEDKAAAMVVANFLLSPEAQLQKADPAVWGDFPIIDTKSLPEDWQKRFAALQKGPATLTDAELQAHQLPEPPSKILMELEKGWQQKVLKEK